MREDLRHLEELAQAAQMPLGLLQKELETFSLLLATKPRLVSVSGTLLFNELIEC